MTPDPLFGALAAVHRHLDALGCAHALVGGLAVSVRAEPRFTRDVDLAVRVTDDAHAEAIISELRARGHAVLVLVEQDRARRLATARLAGPSGVPVDLLFASSGLEVEVVERAEEVQVRGLALDVARAEDLLAMKVLSMTPRRPQDEVDARALLAVNPRLDMADVRRSLSLIQARGHDRGEPLDEKLSRLLSAEVPPGRG